MYLQLNINFNPNLFEKFLKIAIRFNVSSFQAGSTERRLQTQRKTLSRQEECK